MKNTTETEKFAKTETEKKTVKNETETETENISQLTEITLLHP